jgi:hypothetical protein
MRPPCYLKTLDTSHPVKQRHIPEEQKMSTALLQKPENLKGDMYASTQEYLHLFLFNDAVSSSEYIASNYRINE